MVTASFTRLAMPNLLSITFIGTQTLGTRFGLILFNSWQFNEKTGKDSSRKVVVLSLCFQQK